MDMASLIGLFGGFGVVLFGAWQWSTRGARIDIFFSRCSSPSAVIRSLMKNKFNKITIADFNTEESRELLFGTGRLLPPQGLGKGPLSGLTITERYNYSGRRSYLMLV